VVWGAVALPVSASRAATDGIAPTVEVEYLKGLPKR